MGTLLLKILFFMLVPAAVLIPLPIWPVFLKLVRLRQGEEILLPREPA